jgi:hypothetical protein
MEDEPMTPSRLVRLALASMLLVFLACDRSPTESGSLEIRFQTVLKTSLPGASPDPERQEVVRDVETWQAIWSVLHAGSDQPPPAIAFGREMVVVILGPGCGGDTTISSIEREGGELVVNAETSSCNFKLCAIADFSLHIVRLPRVEVPVRFNVRRSAGFC